MVEASDFIIETNILPRATKIDGNVVASFIRVVDAMSRMTYQSIYLMDYYEQNFLYISENPLFQCGHTTTEIKKMGFRFYLQHVPKEEQEMLTELNRRGYDFFEDIDDDEKKSCSISCDFHLVCGRKKILVNHKITPILLSEDGHIRLAMCLVSLSANKRPGYAHFLKEGSSIFWKYSFETHKWIAHDRLVIKEEEKDVLRLAIEGFTINQIADKMCRSIDTIKFYRKNLFEKLGVTNIVEAISQARHFKLL